jgi:hypothetical protein
MINKFQTLVKNILENNTAGAGGVFGAPEVGFEISNPTSSNPDKGYTDNIKAAMATAQPNIVSKKKKKKKKGVLYVTRRPLHRKEL